MSRRLGLCCWSGSRRRSYTVECPSDEDRIVTSTGDASVDPERLCAAVCRDKVSFIEDQLPHNSHFLQECRFFISDARPTHIMTLAVICASPNVLKILLQKTRCNPNMEDPLFSTPLEVLLLSWDCRPEELPLVLCNTRHQHRPQTEMNSVFHFHKKFIPSDRSWKKWLSNRERCLRLLCQAGADVNRTLVYIPLLPLEYAVTMAPESGIKVASVLLDSGVDINRGIRETVSPLIRAVNRCNIKMVRFLLERGALIELGSGESYYNGFLSTFESPGFQGIFFYQKVVEILKLLLKYGGDPNSVEPETGRSALLCATMDCRKILCNRFIECLLEYGAAASINLPDDTGCTPIIIACERRDLKSIQLLLDHGVDLRVSLEGGKSPLFLFLDDMFTLSEKNKYFYRGPSSSTQCLPLELFNEVLNGLLDSCNGPRLTDETGKLPVLLRSRKYHKQGQYLLELCSDVPTLKLMCRNTIKRSIRGKHLNEKALAPFLPRRLQRFVFDPLIRFQT